MTRDVCNSKNWLLGIDSVFQLVQARHKLSTTRLKPWLCFVVVRICQLSIVYAHLSTRIAWLHAGNIAATELSIDCRRLVITRTEKYDSIQH